MELRGKEKVMFRCTINVKETETAVESAKTHNFHAECLGYVLAPHLVACDKNQRPLLAVFAGNEAGIRPFLANLTDGKKAQMGDRHGGNGLGIGQRNEMEFLRSTKPSTIWQKNAYKETSIATVFLPDCFALEPGLISPFGCAFLSAPLKKWCEGIMREVEADGRLGGIMEHAQRLGIVPTNGRVEVRSISEEAVYRYIPLAIHFGMMLDKRTKNPIPFDVRFLLQLYLALIQSGTTFTKASDDDDPLPTDKLNGGRLTVHGMAALGYAPMTGINAHYTRLNGVMSEQVKIYQEIVN